MLVVFVAGTVLCAVVTSSCRYLLTERERSEALQLAWSRAHDCSITAGYVYEGNADASPSFSPSTASSPYVDAVPSDPQIEVAQLWQVSHTITTPSGHIYQFEQLAHGQRLQDVTTGNVAATQGTVLFVDPALLVEIYQDGGTAPAQVLPVMPWHVPLGVPGLSNQPVLEVAAGLCVDPQLQTLWASDSNLWGINQAPPLAFQGWPAQEQPIGFGNGFAAGMCLNQALPPTTDMWVVDQVKRRIEHATLTNLVASFDQSLAPPPPTSPNGVPPLLLPSHMAWDERGNTPGVTLGGILWITDLGNLCLRSYTVATGVWSAPIRPSLGGVWMGRPRGVAVDGGGNVYTADGVNFWTYTALSGQWSLTHLPGKLANQITSMHYTLTTGKLWINTYNGALWNYYLGTFHLATWAAAGRTGP
jgi:hypothetical protein